MRSASSGRILAFSLLINISKHSNAKYLQCLENFLAASEKIFLCAKTLPPSFVSGPS